MSLATRCTACGTVFRVVQDQLKVSEGWVRCGRCQEVFNAIEGLFDLDRETPPAWPKTEQPTEEPAPPPPAAELAPDALAARSLLHSDDGESQGDFADARFPSELLGDTDEQDDQAPAAPPLEAEAPPAPQFVRAAERAAVWRSPRRRAALAFAVLGLAALLVVQAGVHFRADAAARWPWTRPLLAGWCGFAGCTIDAPRALEQLAVDSSGLVKIDNNGLYRFDLVLRNRGEVEVMLPALDLTLTDAAGRVVARKVVRAGELGAARDVIAARSELPLHALLDSGDARLAGYTVDLFYP
jgi:predicted Zn finger-like uncharacterized protein